MAASGEHVKALVRSHASGDDAAFTLSRRGGFDGPGRFL